MSIAIINKDKCNTCIHKKVCQYQFEKKEVINQINTRVSNVSTESDNFTITFNCLNYYKDEKTKMIDSLNTVNNPYW